MMPRTPGEQFDEYPPSFPMEQLHYYGERQGSFRPARYNSAPVYYSPSQYQPRPAFYPRQDFGPYYNDGGARDSYYADYDRDRSPESSEDRDRSGRKRRHHKGSKHRHRHSKHHRNHRHRRNKHSLENDNDRRSDRDYELPRLSLGAEISRSRRKIGDASTTVKESESSMAPVSSPEPGLIEDDEDDGAVDNPETFPTGMPYSVSSFPIAYSGASDLERRLLTKSPEKIKLKF